MKLTVRLTPNAKDNQIAGWEGETLLVRIHAPPREGAANTELIRFLAERLRLPKTSITLDRGSRSRLKTVDLPLTPAQIRSCLERR